MDRKIETCDNINEGSRLGFNSQSQMEMTQLTQTMDDLDDQPSQLSNLIEAEVPKVDPSKIPWARLIPHIQKDKIDISQEGISESVEGKYDLLPRGPEDMIGRSTRSRSITSPNMGTPSNDEITVLGCLKNIKSFDRFNEYTIGRNMKCDIVAQKTRADSNDTEKLNMRNVIHSFVSNYHCRIFCLLSSNSVGPSVDGHGTDMEIYIEDTSGNGTILNNTTILKRNERRRLHTGDTICLLHPKLVKKKIKDFKAQQEFFDFYSFVFINLHETQRFKMTNGKMEIETPATTSSKSRLTELFTNSAKSQNKRAAVNARATNSNSIQRYGQSNKEINDLSSVRKNIDKSHEAMQPPPAKKPKVARLISSTSTFKARRIEEYYDLRDEIGSGTCGTVRRAINRKTGEMVAVKVIVIGNQGGLHRTFSKISKDGLLDPNIRAEISILQNLSHPYVVKLIDHFVHPGKAVYLVMELMQGGDLFDRIVQKGCYSELESRRIMRRMLAAVHYLHEDRDIVHRDLKPENILCVSRKNDIEVKLTDFGLAKSITEDGLKTFCGTPQYFAPEVLRRRNTVAGTGRYGKEADIWSIGVILYILLSGAPPFEATMDASSSTMISFYGNGWRNITDDAKDLISRMLTKNPLQRINIKDACSHRWILIEDGDTHVHPLNDPVVLEATGGTQANNSCRNGQGQQGPQCPSPCDPIQNSNEIRNIINGGQSLPSSAARVNSNPRQNVLDAVHLAKEGESPNQSALFPTPKAKEEKDGRAVNFVPRTVEEIITSSAEADGESTISCRRQLKQQRERRGTGAIIRYVDQKCDDLKEVKDASVDVVISLQAAVRMKENGQDWKKSISEASRVLKPGRRFLFVEQTEIDGKKYIDAIAAIADGETDEEGNVITYPVFDLVGVDDVDLVIVHHIAGVVQKTEYAGLTQEQIENKASVDEKARIADLSISAFERGLKKRKKKKKKGIQQGEEEA